MAITYTKKDQGNTITVGTGTPDSNGLTGIAGDKYTDQTSGLEYIYTTAWGSLATSDSPTFTDMVTVNGTVDIVHTATETNDYALEIDCDAVGFGDVKALDIAYRTGAIGAGEDEGVILVNIDEALSTGGEVFALEVLTTDFGSTSVYGMKTGVNVSPISQDSGASGNPASALNKAVDVLSAISSGGAGNVTMFVADNDTVTIGLGTKFDEMEILMDIFASQNILATFEYSTGVGTWAVFVPTDGTNGFRNTGSILWDKTDLVGWVVGTGSEFLIRITRTRNTLVTAPRVDTIQITNPAVFSWNKDGDVTVNNITSVSGVVAIKETTTPTATPDYGKIYTKSDNKLYFQDGAGTEHEIAFV